MARQFSCAVLLASQIRRVVWIANCPAPGPCKTHHLPLIQRASQTMHRLAQVPERLYEQRTLVPRPHQTRHVDFNHLLQAATMIC